MQPPLDNHALTLYHDEESFLQLYSSSPTGVLATQMNRQVLVAQL